MIARGTFGLYKSGTKEFNKEVLNELTVTLKHGYKYSVEATLINDYNLQTPSTEDATSLLAVKGKEGSSVDNSRVGDADLFTHTLYTDKEFINLNQHSKDSKGIRYYYKGTYTAKYPATESEEVNIPINLTCKSYKVSYQFANIPVDENHAIIASIGGNEMGREEGYTKDNFTTSTTVSEWYELRSMSSADETFGKITIALVNAKAAGPEFTEEDIYKVFEKTPKAGSKLTPGHHYTITTDFGIEAGVNITVDTYTLIEVDPIDMNAKETNEQ